MAWRRRGVRGRRPAGPGRAARRREPAGRPRSRPLPRLRPSPPGPDAAPPHAGTHALACRRRTSRGPAPSVPGVAAGGAAAASRPLGPLGRGCPLGRRVDSLGGSRVRPGVGAGAKSTRPRPQRCPASAPRDRGLPSTRSGQPARPPARRCAPGGPALAAATRASSVTPCWGQGAHGGKGGPCPARSPGDPGRCRRSAAGSPAVGSAPRPTHLRAPGSTGWPCLPSVCSPGCCWALGAVAADPCWLRRVLSLVLE